MFTATDHRVHAQNTIELICFLLLLSKLFNSKLYLMCTTLVFNLALAEASLTVVSIDS